MTEAAIPAPKQVSLSFPLQEGEQVLEVCRRHWIYLWPNMAIHLLVMLAPPVAFGVVLSATDAYEGILAKVFWVAAAIWFLYWGVRTFLAWYRYHNDAWVITNQRLIDSFKTNPFSLKISTADLVNVQDITVDRHGVVRTLLDYGDIICQTAADEQRDFHLTGIPQPREVQSIIDRERDRERLRFRG
ncbi:MAG: hypothetical protein GEU75_03935 [Dehalococcoidia bacterium]|nr:hypothetical protein [Dehalococcoidia bacterium]